MDDVSFKVRQIAQYPPATTLNPEDVFLVQQGGLTGPYKSATRDLIVNGALGMSAGLLTPLPQVGLAASFTTVPNGPRSGFNWFLDQSSIVRYMQAGVAGRWDFGEGSLNFSIAPQGLAGTQIYEPWWLKLFDLDYSGNLTVYQQVRCGRPPGLCEEVVTLGYLQACAVTSFNGRFGNICLNAADVNAALEVLQGDSVVTKYWVDDAISRALDQFYFCKQLVTSFNGRIGNVVLLATDVSKALFADPPNSTAPTPPPGDDSNLIATTAFVTVAINNYNNTLQGELSSYALLNSPEFTGIPTAPTAAPGTSTGQLATTAFVMQAISSAVAGVSSFNARTGAVVLTQQDIINANGWDSVALTTIATAPTPAPGDSSTKIATTAFVTAALSGSNVSSFNTRTGAVTLTAADITGAGGALLAGPTFTGIPAAPTAAPGTSTTQLATTAFVTAAITAATAGVSSFNGRTGAVSLQASDVSAVGGALLVSPAFTGSPTAPTQTVGTSNTTLATTAFVMAAIAAASTVSPATALPLMDGVAAVGTSLLYARQDHVHPSDTTLAPLASPTFTGVPAVPTAAPGTSTTQAASTAFVGAAITAAVPATVKSVQLTAAFSGQPAASAIVVIPITFAMTIAASLAGSVGNAQTAPAAAAAFTVKNGATTIGTVSVATSGTVTFSGSGGALAAGNILTVIAPATQDTALANVGISLLATRS